MKEILEERLASYHEHARALTGDDTFNIGGHKRMMHAIYGATNADNDTELTA